MSKWQMDIVVYKIDDKRGTVKMSSTCHKNIEAKGKGKKEKEREDKTKPNEEQKESQSRL